MFESGVAATRVIGRTEYDNIRQDAVPLIREWMLEEGSAFHKRASKFLAQFDLDIEPDEEPVAAGVKVSIGTFSKVRQDSKEVADE